jgi:hypothetical protein
MKERIRKMPRPVPRSRFSGARGSGSVSGIEPLPWSAMVNHQRRAGVLKADGDLLGGVVFVAVQHGVDGGLAHRHGEWKRSSSSRPASSASFSAAASTSLTLSMVELSEKLIRPALGPLTGFDIRLFWSGTGHFPSAPQQPCWQFHGWKGLCQAGNIDIWNND